MATYTIGRVGLRLRGEYDSTVTYSKLDVVTYGGSSYAAKQTVTGVSPTNTTYWQMMAGNVQDEYTDDEILTGKVWFDGKPIYRRTLQASVTAGYYGYTPDIPNVDIVVHIDGALITADKITRPLNWWHNEYFYVEAYRYGTESRITVYSKFDTGTAYVTVDYTKL